MTRTPQRLGYGTFDGFVALSIVTFGLAPGSHWHHTLHELTVWHVSLLDAVFAIFFMFAWRYCFTVLNLYDKFATVPSRTLAILKGILIMLVPAATYYRLEHPDLLRLRALVLTGIALFIYEVNRSAFQVHLLDRLAARDPRRALIIGSGRRASKAWRVVRTRYRLSLKLLGFVDNRHTDDMPPDIARRYLGTLEELDQIMLTEVVDLILIAMPIRSCYALMQDAIHVAESAGVQILYLDDIYSTRAQNRDTSALLFRDLAADQEHYLVFLITKRILDIVGALLGLVLLSPLLVGIAIAIRLESKGPAIFRQERYGYRRRRFTMLKFRSMVHNAQDLLPDLEQANEATGPIFKIRDDPRVTKLGKRLRKSSLDELPQLWNVLVGDMSLVGPRPMSVRDVSLFGTAAMTRRFSVKPGITGLWQVSGRSSTGFDHWVAMDNSYIDKRSVANDFRILARTIGAVIRGSGAM